MNDEIEGRPEQPEEASSLALVQQPAAGALRMESAALAAAGSDVGHVRENNEDNFLLLPERGLFAVCDGMGGHAAGEEASALAVSTLRDGLSGDRVAEAVARGEDEVKILFINAFQQASEAILVAAAEHDGWAGMGTTVVAALCVGSLLYVANAGDSRAYLLRAGTLTQLSRDHSVAAVLVEQGQLTAEEGHNHPLRNQLISVLGSPKSLIIETNLFDWRPGDRLLLCSDGLWDMLSDEEIARIAGARPDPTTAVRALITAANAAGGKDNITVIVVCLPPPSSGEGDHSARDV